MDTKDKVWMVYRSEYGRSGSEVMYICSTREIAESYRSYEYALDIEGPIYSIKRMDIKTKDAPEWL
jgi:hypothetical protein